MKYVLDKTQEQNTHTLLITDNLIVRSEKLYTIYSIYLDIYMYVFAMLALVIGLIKLKLHVLSTQLFHIYDHNRAFYPMFPEFAFIYYTI